MIQDLSPRQRIAAAELAQGKTHEAAAAAAQVKRATVERWLKHAGFVDAVEAETEAIRERIRAEGIANRQNRIDAYNQDWQKLQRVIEARAQDPLMQGVPGGDTGLLVAEPMLVKVYAAGDEDDDALRPLKESRLVYAYKVDVGVLKERRELAKQAAQELGQGAVMKTLDLSKLTTEQLERLANGDDLLSVLAGG